MKTTTIGVTVLCLAALVAPASARPAAAEPAPEEKSMSSSIEIIQDFVAAFNVKDVDRVMTFFTEDAIYHNMPGDPVQGKEAVRNVIASYVNAASVVDWEILVISEVGPTVLTERVDRFVFGEKKVVLPVMGAFDMRDGKIAAWRDYFDQASWTRQMAD